MDLLLSVEEAARRLGGLSPYTIHSWLSSGKLRRTKLGRRTMIRESELERVIAEGDGKKSPGRPRPKVENTGPEPESRQRWRATIPPATPSNPPGADRESGWQEQGW
jgi:excisionase family DNA binding protein